MKIIRSRCSCFFDPATFLPLHCSRLRYAAPPPAVSRAATAAGLDRRYLYRLLHRHGLDPEREERDPPYPGDLMRDAAPIHEPLLTPRDPAPLRVVAPPSSTAPAAILVVCDHASNAVPERLGSLGLPSAELGRHIGWDIGAEAVARALAARLGAPAVLASFSRLVIDCNRGLDDPSAIAAQSDGTVVPGNAGLDPAARRARAEEIYWPYHRAVGAALDALAARGAAPALVSVHSFTPRMNGFHRPWHVGVLWDQDPRVAVPLLRALSGHAGLVVGDNEPYTARSPVDFTVPHHAGPRALRHVTLEIRQNEIDSAEGAARYAALIALALAPILADAGP
jgi:predicted N-formylglutamate amidohydrolase